MGWFDERFDERPERFRFDCIACGKPMYFPACKHGKYKTCGGECAKVPAQQSASKRFRNCETCGKGFVPRQLQLNVGHGRYCSQKCNTAGREVLKVDEVKARALQTRKERFSSGVYKKRVGPDSPSWKGGRAAVMERTRAQRAEYKRKNKEKVREHSATRRARGSHRVPPNTVKRLKTLQRGKCAVCKCNLPEGFHLDHIVPVAKGGLSEFTNFQLLCPPCNLRKAAKDPIKFMQQMGMLC